VVCGLLACLVGASADVVALLSALSLRGVPPGSEIRPLAGALAVAVLWLGGWLVGLPLAAFGTAVCLVRRCWWGVALGIAGMVLAVLPDPIYQRITEQIVRINHLRLAP
jgi:hypothetical protein